VARDPLIDELIAEIDQALAAARAARRIVAEIAKGERAVEKARGRAAQDPPGADVSRTLRFSGMTIHEAAATLGVSNERVRVMLQKRQLIGVKFAGSVGWRVARDSVALVAAQWAEQRRGRWAPPAGSTARRPRPDRRSD
jgi:excisionase family DNA binding protein